MEKSEKNAAYQLLLKLDEQCRQHAFELPAQEEKGSFWSGIGFVLNSKRYLAPLSEVAEILHLPVFTFVPGARNWVRGVANVRGTLLPIMDLQGFIFDKPNRARRQRLMVISKGELTSGVIVDDVIGLQHFEEFERLQDSPEADAEVAPFVQGSFRRNEQVWTIFSLHALAEDVNFLQVAV